MYIRKWIGQGQLSHYMSQVMICTDEFYQYTNIHKCKEYIRNDAFCRQLEATLKLYEAIELSEIESDIQLEDDVREVAIEYLTNEYLEELTSKNFKYDHKSYRMYHALQSVKKEIRNAVLVRCGLVWDYDIDNCAFTLIRQLATKCGVDQPLPAFDDYLANKNYYRNEIADAFQIPLSDCKQLINALLFGSKLSSYSTNQLFRDYLKSNHLKLQCLKEYDFLIQLRNEFRICWKAIEMKSELVNLYYKTNELTGKRRKLAMTCRSKASVYFQLESLVMRSIDRYLLMIHNPNFKIHDGFVSETDIDVDELSRYVLANTGYDISLKSVDLRIEIGIREGKAASAMLTSDIAIGEEHDGEVIDVISDDIMCASDVVSNKAIGSDIDMTSNQDNDGEVIEVISEDIINSDMGLIIKKEGNTADIQSPIRLEVIYINMIPLENIENAPETQQNRDVTENVTRSTSTERMRKLRAKQPKKEKKPPMTATERKQKSREKKRLEQQRLAEELKNESATSNATIVEDIPRYCVEEVWKPVADIYCNIETVKAVEPLKWRIPPHPLEARYK
jgi:hypothetical protein